jgi:hypothetical protein
MVNQFCSYFVSSSDFSISSSGLAGGGDFGGLIPAELGGMSFSFLKAPHPARCPQEGHLINPRGPKLKPRPDLFSVRNGRSKR